MWIRAKGRGSARRNMGVGEGAGSVRVDDESREGAVLVSVTAVHLPTVQLDEDLVTHIQVQNDAVAGIVVVLISILSNGAGPDLVREEGTNRPCAELN